MLYNCSICNYSTLSKSNYNRHIETIKHKSREIYCKNIFICDKCNKKLSTKQWLDNHVKNCRGTTSIVECGKCNKEFNNRYSRYAHEKKCKEIDKNIILCKDNITNNITNNIVNNITNNNTINITINNIGKENIDYFLEHTDFSNFMYNCIENKTNGICNLIAKKHFDPEHPENHNIRKFNKKDNFLEIYDNNSWNIKNYKDGLDYITIPLENTFLIFMEKIIENNETIKDNIFTHFMREVGTILGWDLSVGDYNFSFNNIEMNNGMNEKSQKLLKTKIYKLFCESIYNYTKIIHKI